MIRSREKLLEGPTACPNLILPNANNPVRHCYPTRSQQQLHYVNHVAKQLFAPDNSQDQANSVTNPVTGQVQEYHHLVKGPNKAVWEKSFANELGRLAQGVASCNHIKGTGKIVFIPKEKVPSGCKVTYGRIVASIAPASPLAATVLIIPVTSAHLPPNSQQQNVSSTAPSQPLIRALLFLTSAISTLAPQWTATNTCASH
jgi:hypothetical protein